MQLLLAELERRAAEEEQPALPVAGQPALPVAWPQVAEEDWQVTDAVQWLESLGNSEVLLPEYLGNELFELQQRLGPQ